MERLIPEQTSPELAGTAFVHLDGILYASFSTPDFASAASLAARVGEVAEELNHHPELRLTWGSISFELTSHDADGVTRRDLELAGRIQELADEAGATADTQVPARYDIAIDTVDADGIRGFWKAVLDYDEVDDDGEIELVDPRGKGPRVWFQHMEPPRTQRNRIHVDVYVPTSDAPDRVQAALDAGGTLLTDEYAPGWWVLADAEGNEACVCTSDL